MPTGRDNGIAYWGDFKQVKVSVGAFDGASLTGNPKILGAGRIQIDLWDQESGYYLNGTYYGGKDLLCQALRRYAEQKNCRSKHGDDGSRQQIGRDDIGMSYGR